MAKARPGSTVRVHCITRNTDGRVVDTTQEKQPLTFRVGAHDVVAPLEEAVCGMQPGDRKACAFRARDAFGPRKRFLVHRVHRSRLPAHLEPRVGQELEIVYPDGSSRAARVTGLSGATVTLDANHPLAGQELTFDVEVLHVD